MIMSATISEPRLKSLTHSPVAVHEQLSDDEKKPKLDDYMTVEKYQWPTSKDTGKTKTITEEERKARHREVQRRFMERKLNNLLMMRSEVKRLEQRYSLLTMNQEVARLQHENQELRWRLQHAREHTSEDFGHVKLHSTEVMPAPVDPMNTNLPWDQILEAVCDTV